MSSPEVADWASSGAMWLTGHSNGPPILPPGRAATVVRHQLATLGLSIPGLLGERAAYAGLGRNGPWSCGGGFRIVPTADGYLGLSLARPTDVDLVPALVEGPVEADPWATVSAWAANTRSVEAEDRVQLLGLPGGLVPPTPPADRPCVISSVLGERRVSPDPLVVDLTSLWAGPLCAHILGRTGARIVKVESVQRPDGARSGSAELFDLLHSGHKQVVVDLDRDIDQLRRMIGVADLVLEASRPRALRQLGLVAEEAVAAGTSWLSITARGRDSAAVGFGDDVAVSAGLVVAERGDLLPAGDAIADPLAGVAAAVAAGAALASEEARLIDVSMRHVVAATLPSSAHAVPHEVRRHGDRWWVETDDVAVPVEEPRRR
jgi:hypothetical protein